MEDKPLESNNEGGP